MLTEAQATVQIGKILGLSCEGEKEEEEEEEEEEVLNKIVELEEKDLERMEGIDHVINEETCTLLFVLSRRLEEDIEHVQKQQSNRALAFTSNTFSEHHPPTLLMEGEEEFDFSDDFYSCHVNSWVRYTVDHLALELDLDFFIDQIYHDDDDDDDNDNDNDNDGLGLGALYDFPFGVLRNSRVRVLKLCHCYLSVPPNLSTMRFHSLKSMVFDQVSLSDDMVSGLILGCLNLEILGIDYCWAIRNLKICSAKLKELSLRNFVGDEESSVEICAPNLISISIAGFEMGKYGLKASSLVKAHLCFPHIISVKNHVDRISIAT
ncbi:hypothetical protein TEA_027422 [Camellia sinensis var. sinensis]|uniref:At1g61320/AtMIF1 LRR domain-containing protein n=1 Tax=Camellia sinensis var. sinensis TaxID=542762 RepID=A0A4S4ETG3_CAMSN|nr:hypothetical protein TEA_027422 [Camellia sinensis var. sinensis]